MTKPLFDINKINSFKSRKLLSLECYCCQKEFSVQAYYIRRSLKLLNNSCRFCSTACSNNYRNRGKITHFVENCYSCQKPTKRYYSEEKVRKKRHVFCSHKCRATFYSKTGKGCSRSKLEKWIQSKLETTYPLLEIKYNDRNEINSELDIFIPSLGLAIELNGVFHYEPIFSKEKLKTIQNNDNRKFQACLEKGIELCVIDTSSQVYFKEDSSLRFLAIIQKLIDSKSGASYR